MTVSSLAPSSLSFLSSSPPQSSAERQTDPQQSHFHREKGEERQSDCSWIWGSFEEHNKAKHTQFHFQFMPGNQSPLSLSPYYFTNPPPFSYTTAKSIEMTRQSEGHSWAQRALWWNARRFAADRTSGKTNAHPASAPACPALVQLEERTELCFLYIYVQNGAEAVSLTENILFP